MGETCCRWCTSSSPSATRPAPWLADAAPHSFQTINSGVDEMSNRQLRLGAILQGVGMTHDGWKQPGVPSNASVNIDWYIEGARRAEAAKFDFVFIVDSPYITPDSAPHFLNRLEPLTLLSAVAGATSRIGLVATLTT